MNKQGDTYGLGYFLNMTAGRPGPTWPAGRAGWHGQDNGLYCSRDDAMKWAIERWRSHKNIGRNASEGEGAAAQRRDSTTRCDANVNNDTSSALQKI